MKTLYRVIEEGLKKTGYEGLYNDRLTCGCERNDIAPCKEPDMEHCLPGYRRTCQNCGTKVTMPSAKLIVKSCPYCGDRKERK